jgi:pimeloyl-ACP methyl ester carboxylesterase
MTDVVFDARPWFQAFSAGQELTHDGVALVHVPLVSRHAAVLVQDDREAESNARFTAPLLLPAHGGAFERLTVLFHGLNEGTDAKLFPWAASLARRGIPALIFPSSFHLARRPSAFLSARGEAFSKRRAVSGNLRSSPYNAVLSHRMAEHPERFARGALQTWRDLVDLARTLEDGTHPALAARFVKGSRLDLLGYSIGGYLASLALLENPDGLFHDTRALLFSTGAALARVRPQTILILDTDAQDRLTRAFDTEEARTGLHPLLPTLGASDSEARWLTRMLYGEQSVGAALGAMTGRVLLVANENDTVFPLDAVKDALGALPREELALGLHELPFNQRTPLGDAYSDREGRRLLIAVLKSYAVADELREGFTQFVDVCARHLGPRGARLTPR